MFGYVRPCRPELKCRELDLYKSTYCGLCCTLRQRYGMLAPMFLSYDMTFLAILLETPQEVPTYCRGRCHANLCITKSRVAPSDALNLAADYTVILAWFGLQDSIADEGFLKKTLALFLSFLLSSSFRKARKLHPDFTQNARQQLETLAQLEKENCDSIDRVADCFATLLQNTVPSQLETDDEPTYRSLQLMLYHVGRWIYLIDARDDFEKDNKQQSYNPLRYRYQGTLDDTSLNETLSHSLSFAYSSLAFLDIGTRTGTIDNILSIGLPLIQRAVLQDTWKTEKNSSMWKRKSIWRKKG